MQQKTECTATFHRFVIGPALGESGGTAGGGPLAPGGGEQGPLSRGRRAQSALSEESSGAEQSWPMGRPLQVLRQSLSDVGKNAYLRIV